MAGKKNIVTAAGLAVAFSLFLFCPGGIAAAGMKLAGLIEGNGTLKTGDKAPFFTGRDINGKEISMDDFKGRPVLIDFSSIFCKPCQETIAEFRELEEKYKGTDLALMIISADVASALPAISNYFKQIGASYPVVTDWDFDISAKFGVHMIPTQFTVDRTGIVRKIHVGFVPELEEILDLPGLLER